MFPTSGYFNHIPCPFYISGLCEKPYCHFKHAKSDDFVGDEHLSKGKIYVPAKQVKPVPYLNAPVYCPTPISQLNQKDQEKSGGGTKRVSDLAPIPRTSKHSRYESSDHPAYTPTPIHRHGESSSYVDEHTSASYSPSCGYSSSPPSYSPVPPKDSLNDSGMLTSEYEVPDDDDDIPGYTPTPVSKPSSSINSERIDIDDIDEDNDTRESFNPHNDSNGSIEYISIPKVTNQKSANNSKPSTPVKVTRTRPNQIDDVVGVEIPHKKKKKSKRATDDAPKVKDTNAEAQPSEVLAKLYTDLFGDEDDAAPVSVSKSSSSSCVKPKPLNNQTPSSSRVYDPVRREMVDLGDNEAKKPSSRPSGVLAKRRLTPKEIMYNRLALHQKEHMEKHKESVADTKKLMVKHRETVSESKKSTSSRSSSSKQISKPSNSPKPKMPRPSLPLSCSNKLPLNIRQKYLSQFIEESLKVYTDESDAYTRALNEEQQAHDRSANRVVYLNSVIKVIKRLREEQQASSKTPSSSGSSSGVRSISHTALMNGVMGDKCGIFNSNWLSPETLHSIVTGPMLPSLLEKYILTDEQLVSNGFPRPSPGDKPDVAFLPGAEEKLKNCPSIKTQRNCARCGTKFDVDVSGETVKFEECVYHWGKAWRQRVAGQGFEQRYNCCSSDLSQRGCQMGPSHVHDWNKWGDPTGYIRTLPPDDSTASSSASKSRDYGIYALDCEMVYTTAGYELARVTVIDRKLSQVYERIVRPLYPVLDYNTKFSGLTEEMVSESSHSIFDIQSDLMKLFNDKTILIGHSLESDLMALKLIHSTVVDTSVAFPHRMGPPKKRALKNVVGEVLQRIIQSDLGGHDSKEDAVVCMELVHHLVKEDLKKQKRKPSST